MKNKLLTLPNVITLCNLACGCAAIVYALPPGGREDFSAATVFWLVAAAAVFDLFDGMAARLTGQHSEIGKQLDSLADLVSFGVAPAAALYTVFEYYPLEWSMVGEVLRFGVFALALFSALRLAKFNVDDTQRGEFRGLPTPAAGLAMVSLLWILSLWSEPNFPIAKWIHNADSWWWHMRLIMYMMMPLFVAATCWLLVSKVRMFKLKLKYTEDLGRKLRNIFLIVAAIMAILFSIGGVFFAVVIYVAMNAAVGRKRIID
jgi:CDP-diacylglycerol--serine O-phosphatidyltransferase